MRRVTMRRLTPETLQLYSDEPTAKTAAREISAAVVVASSTIRRSIREQRIESVSKAARVVGDAYTSIVYPVLDRHADAGARDTEPRGVVAQKLVDAAKDALGIDYYCPELGELI